MTRHPNALRWTGLAAAWITLGVHLDLVNDHLAEKPYIGWLFVAGVAALVPVIVGLAANRRPAPVWTWGALVSTGMALGFVASRTVGLPQGYLEGWTTDHALGLVSLATEVIFVIAALAARPGQPRAGSEAYPAPSGRYVQRTPTVNHR